MRIALAVFALALMVSPAAADPSLRAFSVVEALDIDEPTANKLLDILTRYDAELDKLERTRSELKRRLVTAHRSDPQRADRLLLDWSANKRSIAQVEDQLITRARQLLPGPKAVHLLMLLAITETGPVVEPAGPTYVTTPTPPRGRHHDPDALFPPGSASRPACDPFASMHGCRY